MAKLGLRVSQDNQAVPSLSRLHLSSTQLSNVSDILASFSEVITVEDGEEHIKGENDTFRLEKPDAWSMANVAKALPSAVKNVLPGVASDSSASENPDAVEDLVNPDELTDKIVDYDKIVKRLVLHESSLPESKQTPYFNHNAFFANLQHYNRTISRNVDASFGNVLLYGEVVTSTNTLLEK